MQQTSGGAGGSAGYGGLFRTCGRELVDIFEVEGGDFLARAVFGDGEVFFLQSADEIAFFVTGNDVHQNQFGGYVQAILRRLGLQCSILREGGGGRAEHQERGGERGA